MPDDIEEVRQETVDGLEQNRIESDRKLNDATHTREDMAAELEFLRKERAVELAKGVSETATAAAKARQQLATEVAYAAGAEAARIDERLHHLDAAVFRINGSIETTGNALNTLRTETQDAVYGLRRDMQARFDNQATTAIATKTEGRRLILQVFSAVLVATIGAAAVIVVALINSSPT